MIANILLGTLMIMVTIAVQAAFIGAAITGLTALGSWIGAGRRITKSIIALTGVSLWLVAGLSVCIWLWAALFLLRGDFPLLEPALYFAVVSFTTLGYGDIVLAEATRLLSGFLATNGLVLFSLTTAFLIEVMRKLHDTGKDHG